MRFFPRNRRATSASLIRRLFSTRKLGLESLEERRNMALTVPAFSSLPGANHTIYLDFDGHVTTGTSWNSSYGVTSINSPAYSTDTDTANFSASELATIERVYRRVAEDFAPFQVNVTTVEPVVDDLIKSSSTDTRWGVRAVITKDVAFNCGCGGIAYIDSFNWSSDTPVYVFNTSEVGVAEAASHEVGHSLGLSHDGTATAGYYQGHGSGATSWAPIMGVGYYVNVSQWDKGEYFGSNNAGTGANYNKGPDDLAVITGYNGFSYKTDGAGNSLAGAVPLSVSGTAVSAAGVIERQSDVDYYSFTTGAGSVTFNLAPASLGANLDIKADLYDSTGTLIASSNPVDALNASFNLTLAEGTYYLAVDGVGVGTPTANPPTGYTDYASIGQYSISGSVVASNQSTLSVVANNSAQNEGNSGATSYTFTISRAGNLNQTSTVDYTVAGSGASPAAASDFVGAAFASGSVTFLAGELTKTVTVDVQGDTTVESNESFSLTLSNPSAGSTIATGSATSVITNDDSPPALPGLSISATSASKAEGTGTTATPFVFTINRTGDLTNSSSVRYSVAGWGTKKASSTDFTGGFATNVLVNFAAGVSSVDITINVVADSTKESNEGFRVTLSSATGATITTATADGSILNDDGVTKAPAGTERDGGRFYGTDGDPRVNEALIAVADPLWSFIPAEMLTPEQLSVPVITWINGTPLVGDWAHGFENGHSHDDHDEHELGDFDDHADDHGTGHDHALVSDMNAGNGSVTVGNS